MVMMSPCCCGKWCHANGTRFWDHSIATCHKRYKQLNVSTCSEQTEELTGCSILEFSFCGTHPIDAETVLEYMDDGGKVLLAPTWHTADDEDHHFYSDYNDWLASLGSSMTISTSFDPVATEATLEDVPFNDGFDSWPIIDAFGPGDEQVTPVSGGITFATIDGQPIAAGEVYGKGRLIFLGQWEWLAYGSATTYGPYFTRLVNWSNSQVFG